MKRMTPFSKVLPVWLAGMLAAAGAATLELGDPKDAGASSTALPVKLLGSNAVVALQFDVNFPAAKLTFLTPELKTVAQGYRITHRELASGRTRVVVYSVPNTALPQNVIVELPIAMQAGSSAGDVPLVIYNIWFADTAGLRIPAFAGYGPVATWKRLSFTPEELNDASISGDLADPETDGLANLLEMLTRGQAKVADPAKMPMVSTVVNLQNQLQYLTLTYRVWKELQGLEPEVQAGTDLQTWPTVVPSVPTGVEDAETIEMRASVLMTGQPKMFLRLTVKRTVTP